MPPSNPGFFPTNELAWHESSAVLRDVVNLLHRSQFPIEQYRIDGSLLSGASSGPHFHDIDAILSIPRERAIEEQLVANMAETLDKATFTVLTTRRFGMETRIAHIKLKMTQAVTSFRILDLWIVHPPFVSMSPIWSKLFSTEEVLWQREIRANISFHLASEDYQKVKALQLAEARWRYAACFGLPLIDDLDNRGQIILDELPITDPPEASTKAFIEAWASGILNDPWLIRPPTQLPDDIHQALSQKKVFQSLPPLEPPWTMVAMRAQNEQSKNFYS